MRDFYFSEYQSWQNLRQYDFTQVLVFLATGIIILLMGGIQLRKHVDSTDILPGKRNVDKTAARLFS